MAEEILTKIEAPPTSIFEPIYRPNDGFKTKLEKLAQKVHGVTDITFSEAAREDLNRFGNLIADLPICLAKTPFSLTADAKKGGLPQSHKLPIERILPSFGAGFVVVTTGEIMLMPGLPKTPRGTLA